WSCLGGLGAGRGWRRGGATLESAMRRRKVSHALGFLPAHVQDAATPSHKGTAMQKIAIALAVALAPVPALAQEDVSLAYPNVAFTFSAAYVGEDAGLFAKHGLKLKPLSIAGPGATNAVISGSADFALASTAVQTRAAARGQRMLSIANPTNRPVVQIILR